MSGYRFASGHWDIYLTAEIIVLQIIVAAAKKNSF